MSTSSCRRRRSRRAASAATSIWSSSAARTSSTSACGCTRTTRCPVPEPIDSKPECQPIMSVHSSDRFRQQAVEALRHAKFKFPSRRKIFIWKKWGFTKYDRDQHQVYWDEVCLVSDGCGVKFFTDHGPLKKREAYERARLA
uniref:60S ribosomal protein L10 n=1 Tax=Culex pipiens TaxID=7175 RepID=A0A8D8JYZ3_CULPI